MSNTAEMAAVTQTDRIDKEIELRAPVSRVWKALTDHREFGTWFKVALDGPFVVGRETTGKMTYPGYEGKPFGATAVEITPERRFVFMWWPCGTEGGTVRTRVEFRLEPTAGGTRLAVTESGFDKLPAEVRREAFVRNDGGWTSQLRNIEAYVNSHV